MVEKPQLTTSERFHAISHVLLIIFKAAPVSVIVELLGSLVSAFLPFATSYFAARTTTSLVGAFNGNHGDGKLTIIFVIVTAMLGIFSLLWNSLQTYLSQLSRYRIEAAVTDQLYQHFLQLDFWRYDEKSTVDSYDKAKDFANVFPYLFSRFSNLTSSLITAIIGLAAAFFVNWVIGLILLAAVIPSLIIQVSLTKAQRKHWEKNIETRRTRSIIEWQLLSPSHMVELRLYGVIRHLLDLRMSLRDKDERMQIDIDRRFALRQLVADIIQSAAEVATLLWIVFQIIARKQPVGQFIFVQQLTSRAINGVSQLVSSMSNIDREIGNLFEYQRFMAIPEASLPTTDLSTVPNSIRFDHVSFHYPASDVDVLHDISFEIKKGDHIAIVGENGAGKTTLIKLLTGIYAPTKGSILFDGVPLREIDPASWHRHIASLSQNFVDYGFATAGENVSLGDISKKPTNDTVMLALQHGEADEFTKKLSHGIDTYLYPWIEHADGSPGTSLSGGQWQRLALARNFYRDSPFIILDEPTSAIDALAESRIFKYLFSLKDRTIITISHRVTTVKKASVIYMLKDGQIVETGTHAELVARKGAYYTMFESQL